MKMLDELNGKTARGEITLSPWEEEFLESLTDQIEHESQLTDKQFMKLHEIYEANQ